MNTTIENWNLDLASGHIVHPSGLYAYVEKPTDQTGALRCVGPFSSYLDNLSKHDFFEHTSKAIEAVEETFSSHGAYSLWGTYTKLEELPKSRIDILGEPYSFIPNPSFRSSSLFESKPANDLEVLLLKEWAFHESPNGLSHRSGISFEFTPKRTLSHRMVCCVEIEDRFDFNTIHSAMLNITVRSLSSIAYRIWMAANTPKRTKVRTRLELVLPPIFRP
jgi:hypothetical protein